MKRYLLALIALLFSASFSYAQAPTKLCIQTNGNNCVQIDATNPLPTTSGTGGVQSVNIQNVLGNPLSALNPVFISPGTGTAFTSVGNVASGSADSGNPVKVGGVYNSAFPTFTTGQRADLQIGTRGSLKVQLAVSDTAANIGAITPNLDGISSSTNIGVSSVPYNYLFNGSTWDRMRGNTTGLFVQTAGYSYVNISTNTNTVVKTAAGIFGKLIVNIIGTTSTATVYDNTTCAGTIIGTFSTLIQTSLDINAAATTGICVTTAGASAANITVLYR